MDSGRTPSVVGTVSPITVLTSVDTRKPATKRFYREEDGTIGKEAYGNIYKVKCCQHPVRNIVELGQLLARLENEPLSFIIRGEPLPDIDLAQPVRRLKHESKGEGPFFRSSERGEPWVCIDFDDVPCPSDLNAETDPEAAIQYLISQLPQEFHNVSCCWQWSCSAGIKGWDSLRAHLWFWLDRPIPDDDLRAWAKAIKKQTKVDPALFNAVQVHYTAAPILESIPDPVPQRSGLLSGDEDVVQLRLIAKPTPKVSTPSGNGLKQTVGFEAWLARIGDHEGGEGFNDPILRAIASSAATHGAAIDREALKARIRERILLAENHDRDEAAIHRYMSDAYLDRSIDGAIEKFGRQGRLIKGLPSHFAVEEVPPEEAHRLIREEKRHWWRRIVFFEEYQTKEAWLEALSKEDEEDWRSFSLSKVIRGSAGIGKSTIALQEIKEMQRAEPGTVVWYLTPTVELAQELAEKFGSRARVIRGRTHRDADGNTLCLKPEAVEAVARRVPSIEKAMCDQGRYHCEHYRSCPYYAQFKRENHVYFMSFEFAFQSGGNKLPSPDMVVIDEDPLNSFVPLYPPFTPEELRKSAGQYAPLAKLIISALYNGKSPKTALHSRRFWTTRRLRRVANKLDEAQSTEIRPGMALGVIQAKLKRQNDTRRAALVFRLLAEEMPLDREDIYSISLARDVPVTWVAPDRRKTDYEDQLLIQYRRKLRFKWHTPILFLDATADPKLLELSVPNLKQSRVDASRNAVTIQTYGFRASKYALTTDQDAVRRLADIELFIGRFPSNINGLLVTHKDAEERVQVPDGWAKAHFGNIRGIDKYKDLDVVIVLGRLQPPASAVERIAKGLVYDRDECLQLLGEEQYPEAERGYRLADGSEFGVRVPCHPDPLVQRILEQKREAEIVQAIDRLRLRWNPEPKLVIILTEIPVDITVDAIVPYRALIQGGSPIDRAAAELGGILPGDPKFLSARFPELWGTPKAASRALQNEKERVVSLNNPTLYKDLYRKWGTLIPGFLTTSTRYNYRRRGQRGRMSVCYSALEPAQTRDWLEKKFGPLAAFEPS